MKKMLVFLLALAMIVTAVPASVMAEAAQNDGQLTLEDLKALNGDEVQIDLKDGLVSFVGGACTPSPVSSAEDARKVLDSMQTLLSGGAAARFEPWNIIQDAAGNRYYIFQQTHADTVVLGGAVKVIADAEGNMLGLTATVVTDLPDEAEAEGVTMKQAEAIVLEHEANSPQGAPELIAGMTTRVVLPVALEADINEEDTVTRFVWSVYTTNPSANLATASDLPYLAHYVTMAGEYLYSLPTILPGDAAGTSGFDASYTFQFMEPVPYTGYVDLADGTEQEIFSMEDAYLEGYFACNKYYADILPKLRGLFRFPQIEDPSTREANDELLKKMQSKEEIPVAVHIRRGDYLDAGNAKILTGICTEDYYRSACALAEEHFAKEGLPIHFYVFSDDPAFAESCRFGTRGEENTVVNVNHGQNAMQDIRLMAACRGIITANSTFSFWGARLNPDPAALKIRPFRHRNNQIPDPEAMHDYWAGYALIDRDGKLR